MGHSCESRNPVSHVSGSLVSQGPWIPACAGMTSKGRLQRIEMVPGLTGKAEMTVKEEDLVSHLGGIDVDVLSTPRLIQLLEEAAINAIRDLVPADQLSLGAVVRIKHLSATPLGMKVTGHAILKEVHKNRLLFLIDAYDEKEKVAEGEHERVLVSKERFSQKVEKKRTG